MGQMLKFEFDFDEVFEGIKQNVIKELSEIEIDSVSSNLRTEIKYEIKNMLELGYSDKEQVKNEIKNEIKDKVFETIIKEFKDKEQARLQDYSNEISNKTSKIHEEMKEEIIEKIVDRLQAIFAQEIRDAVRSQTENLINSHIFVNKSTANLSVDYEELQRRSRILEALEHGGVDNWSGYSYSIKEYEKNFGKI